MTHCYNVCIFILWVSRIPISLVAGSFTVFFLLGLFSFYLDQIPFAEVKV